MSGRTRIKITREMLEKASKVGSKRRGFGISTTYFGRHRKVMEALQRLKFPRGKIVVHIFGPGGILYGLHPTEHLEVASFLKHKNAEIHVFDVNEENLRALSEKRIRVGVTRELKDYFKRFLPGAKRRFIGGRDIVVSGRRMRVDIYDVEVPKNLLGGIRFYKLDLVKSKPDKLADIAICLNLHQSLSFKNEREFTKLSKKSAALISGKPVSQVFSSGDLRDLAKRAGEQRVLGSKVLVNILSSLKEGGYLITDLVEDLRIDPGSVGLKEKEVLDVESRTSFGGLIDERKVVLYKFVNQGKIKKLLEQK